MSEKESSKLQYKRVLLKISGEALMGKLQYGHDLDVIKDICAQIKKIYEQGCEVCLVVGGGNIFRGIAGASAGMDRSSADYMGMLATVLNALAIQNILEKLDLETRVLSAIDMKEICEPYIRRRAIRHIERGRIVIFAAGTGNPFFTTDTAAALRAVEMNCDALFKATQVDGVYSDDPKSNPKAERYDRLSYTDVLARNLKVMDASAISLARDNNLPVVIFAINEQDSLSKIVCGEGRYSVVN